MTSIPEFSVDGLLGHASGLRALARALLGDEHAAEDVLQDTWVAALEGPAGACARPAGWLFGVTRKLALKRRRSEGRRAARERFVSREERVAAVDEGIAEREVLRSVVDAVLGLDEPYQSVVVMRYYQDLPPRAIAAHLGVPVATVSSQLHRALVRLRARLDSGDERRRWVSALVAVTGWQGAAPGAAVGGALFGGIAMQWKVLLGAASVAVVALGAWNLAPGFVKGGPEGPGAQVQLAAVPATGGADPVAQQAGGAAAQDSRRPVVPSTDATPGTLIPGLVAPEYAYSLEGVVVDERDLPISGARVFAAPLARPLNDLGGTGNNGTFAVSWHARVPAMTLVVYVQKSGFADGGLRLLDVHAGRDSSVRMAMRRDGANKVEKAKLGLLKRKMEETGEPADKARLVEELRSLDMLGAKSTAHEIAPRFGMAPAPGGFARFRWPTLAGLDFARGQVMKAGRFEGPKIDALRALGYVSEKKARERVVPVRITGTLHDASGTPRDGVLLATHETSWRAFSSGEGGLFELTAPAGGVVTVRAGGGDFGLEERSFDLSETAPGAEVTWEPVLDRGHELRGRVTGPEGVLIGGWVVAWRSESGGAVWEDSTICRAGEFAIPNLPLEAGTLVLRDDPSHVFASHVVASVRPGPGELELDVTNEAVGHVVVAVTDRAGVPVADAEVRLWQESSGRGAWMRWKPDSEHYYFGPAPAGSYRVAVGTIGRGFVEIGGVQVVDGEETDLGAVNLPEPGELEWNVTPPEGVGAAELAWALLRRGPALDTLVAGGPLGEPARESSAESYRELVTRSLPPGEYLVAVEGADFSMPPVPVRIAPGAEQTVALALDTYREVTVGVAGLEASEPARFAILEDASGTEVHSGTLAGARGRIHLAPGDYRVEVRSGERRGEATFEVGLAGAVQVDVDMK